MKNRVESDFRSDGELAGWKNTEKWTFNLVHYDHAKGFFIMLSFVSMISIGLFAFPLITNFFLNQEIELTKIIFSILSFLGCIWGIMAHNQFDSATKTIRNTWSSSRKLDPQIGEYNVRTFNPETRQMEEGYTHYGLVDFWDSENVVPQWLDKGKYWKLFLEIQKINKNTILQVTKDSNLPFNQGKKNLTVTIKEKDHKNLSKKKAGDSTKRTTFRILIPQWLVINTEYKRFVTDTQIEISTLTSTISDVNKNMPKIIEEIMFREKTVLEQPWNIIVSMITYLNKSLPIRIIYTKVIDTLPGAKKRQIQNTNDNLSRIPMDALIQSIIIKAKTNGVKEESTSKLHSLTEFLKNEYDKLGLGEGSSEYHNFHHSLEVAYMSLNMLPKEIHGYSINNKDYEIMLLAALLHDYDPLQNIKRYNSKLSRVPSVPNTISEIRKRRIHDAYFSLGNEDLIKFFRKYESPLLPIKEFATTNPNILRNKENTTEGKIIEALIWRTEYPFDDTAQNSFNQLLIEISNYGYSAEKINIIAEILSLSDLSVTYLSSDPLLAWNRVVKLYEELDFPLVEAVARTDRFLSLFSEGSLFKEIVFRKNFPEIFRQKWENVYHFFHEGNPSNRINNIILESKTKYQKINMVLDITNFDFLLSNAINNRNKFFIGIGKNRQEIIRAKSKLMGTDIENLEILPGNIEKLLPFIKDKSIDNFILTIIDKNLKNDEKKAQLLRDLLHSYGSKLVLGGTIEIITEEEQYNYILTSIIPEYEFKVVKVADDILPKTPMNNNLINSDNIKKIKIITLQSYNDIP